MNRNVPEPDLVVHLLAPLDVLIQRISSRGRSYEQEMSPDYLEQLCSIYHQEFTRNASFPVIHLDTTDIDFRKSENINRLLQIILTGEHGRIDPQEFLSLQPQSSFSFQDQLTTQQNS